MTRQRGHESGWRERAFARRRGERKSERHPERGYEGAEEGRARRGEWR